MIPGEVFTLEGEIELNAGQPSVTLVVANTGDRPVQVGSHYHFAETNTALASRTLAGNEDQDVTALMCRVLMLGVDADGIGYLLDEASDPQITRWDIRADTIEPTDLTFDWTMTFSEQLTQAGINNVYYESPGTAHEWLTWRRCFKEFAPRLFR